MSLQASQAALADLLRRSAPLANDDAEAAAIATGNDRLSPVEQVDVYREQFFLRHVDALREDYASIACFLGDEAFEKLAHDYLAKHPPSTFTLRDLGASLPAFVAHDPILRDLARVEWAFVEAFDAKEEPPFDPATLASVPEDAWPTARIVFHPAMQLVSMAHAGHVFRRAVKQGDAPESPAPLPSFVVVYRGRGPEALQYVDVDRDAFALLEALAAGEALGPACERAAAASGVAPEVFQAKVGAWFAEWTSRGWLVRVGAG